MTDEELPECYCNGPAVIARGQHLPSCERRVRLRMSREEAVVRDMEIMESYEDEVRAEAVRRATAAGRAS